MKIEGLGNIKAFQSILQPINKNPQSIVSKINANIAMKQNNADTLELSQKAKNLLKQTDETEKADKTPKIDYENSKQVGRYTEAQWAEMALQQQHSGLESLYNALDFTKKQVEYAMSRIEELQGIADGTVKSDISPETAQKWIEGYRASMTSSAYGGIVRDYSKLVDFIKGFYGGWQNSYDEASGGLASQICEDYLGGLSAESLGLTGLSGDKPEEILQALDKAMATIEEKIGNLENSFFEAIGGKQNLHNSVYGENAQQEWQHKKPQSGGKWEKEYLENYRRLVESGKFESDILFGETDQAEYIDVSNTDFSAGTLNFDKNLIKL